MSTRLTRRTVLRSGAFTIGLPLLDAMARPRAARAASPVRFVVFFEPGGGIREKWTPTGTETSFNLSPELMPLSTLKSKCLFLSGIAMKSCRTGPGDDHQKGMAHQLTATALQSGNNLGAGMAGGISIDQAIANVISKDRIKSVELGVQVWTGFAPGGGGTAWDYVAYSGPGKPLPAEDNPATLFSRLFANLPTPSGGGAPAGPDPALVQRLMNRQSVLDYVKDSYSSLLPKVSAADRAKLDAHLTNIRGIEQQLVTIPTSSTGGGGPGASCAKPTLATVGYHDRSKYGDVGKLQSDLLAMALACDLTRVASLQYHRSGSDVVFNFLGTGITRDHHSINHDGDTNQTSLDQSAAINTWYAGQFSYLLQKLDAMKEDGGSVLDNSLVLWTKELTRGNVHSHDNQPYVLAGSAGGKIQPGRFLTYNGRSHNDLFLTCMAALGVPGNTFGDPSLCTGVLPGIV